VDEVVQSMDILVRQGKVLYWGTSKWEAAQVIQAIGAARQNGLIVPSMEQPVYNMFQRESVEVDLAHVVREFGLGLTTFSPLFNGILSGKYNDGIPANSRAALPEMGWLHEMITSDRIARVRRLTGLAQELGMTTAQLSIAWLLRRKEVSSVITGATRMEQLDENLMAAEAVEKLNNDVLERIEQIIGNIPE
jgi:aryl-alcohol dehydrogenase-like predicted oxidoreductase